MSVYEGKGQGQPLDSFEPTDGIIRGVAHLNSKEDQMRFPRLVLLFAFVVTVVLAANASHHLLSNISVTPVYSRVLNSGAAKNSCTDIPISITFLATTVAPAAISNDISGTPYQGLGNTVIHICSGTNDATMVLAHSSRSVSIQFPEPIPGSIIVAGPPSFAGGP